MSFNIKQVEEILEISIDENDIPVFETAFTHRSFLNEHANYELPSNERLEFLGDAVLQLLSSEFLYTQYDKPEGELTNYRSAIVKTKSLAKEAKRLGFGNLLHLSKGEESSGGREREYILANTFEAVLGAIYLTKGIEEAAKFTHRELFYKTQTIVESKSYRDSKSTFQEMAQEKHGVTPIYRVIDSWGADHNKTFKVGVYLNEKLFGIGEGGSKQKAEQNAATEALNNL